jgi:hypothetical protein
MTTIVSYGAGTNSTAMLVGLHERGERPDFILFADTGGERPETYRHRDTVSNWCESVGFPRIVMVRKEGNMETLEENCLRVNMLPSIAYGFKSCSGKYKIQPQEKWANNNAQCKDVWKAGGKVLKLIGYDADEHHRAKIPEDKKYTYRYPLVEWDWGREECVEAIDRAGLPQPGKSACFFCPSSKPREILELSRTHPGLLARALAMEANAELTSVKGLGRSFAWRDLVRFNEAQIDMFAHTPEIPCGCYDG